MVQQIYGIVAVGRQHVRSRDGRRRAALSSKRKRLALRSAACAFRSCPARAIFDLGVGDGRIGPSADCGYPCGARPPRPIPSQEGSVGAGAGATLGKYLGMERAMKSGVGSASATHADGTIVAALVVANPLGDVIDPDTGRIVAGVRNANGNGFADVRQLIRSGRPRPPGGGNTTHRRRSPPTRG